MLVQTSLAALAAGEKVQLGLGDTLRVSYTFNYKVAETTGVEIWAALYNYSPGYFDRKEAAQTKEIIDLEATLTYRPYEGEIDIVIGDVSSGTYGLICELPKCKDVEQRIDDCIEVSAPAGVFEMIGPLLVLGLMAGLMSMMAPMMEEGLG